MSVNSVQAKKIAQVAPEWLSFLKIIHERRALILMIASIFMLYLIFSSAIYILHYSGDDFKYSFGGIAKSCAENDGYHFMLTIGRPLQSFIDCLGFKFAYTLEGMRAIRMITIIVMGCVMGLFADSLCAFGAPLGFAFFVSGCLTLVAHLYGDAVPMGAISLPTALLFAILSYRWLQKFHSTSRLIYLIGAFFAILASLLTYPALAFFYVTCMLAKLLFANLMHITQIRRELIKEFFVLVTACLLYFAWAYYNVHYHPRTELPAAYQVGQPNLNISTMYSRLLLIANLFTPWWPISPMMDINTQAWLMITILFTGMSIAFVNFYNYLLTVENKQRRQLMFNLLQASIGVAGLLILSSSFFLLMPNLSLVENRVLYATITAGLLFIAWGLWQWRYLFPSNLQQFLIISMVAFIFIVQAYQASRIVWGSALDHVAYLESTIGLIDHHYKKSQHLQRIHYIIPQMYSAYDKYPLTNAALNELIPGHAKARWCARAVAGSINETSMCIHEQMKKGIVVTYSVDDEKFLVSQNMLVLKNDYRSTNPNQLITG